MNPCKMGFELFMKRVIVAICALLCLTASVIAQQKDDKIYKLRAEDVVRVQVFNQVQISGEFQVGEDGNVTIPFAGIVRAEGKTTNELETELYTIYVKKLKLREPIVSVTIIRFRQLIAFINGFVLRPSGYPIRPGDTLLTLITQAGGIVKERADSRRARLKRKGWNEEVPIDLYALTELGDLSQNYEIQDGDVIEVPEMENNLVTVLGAVRIPGAFPFRESMTVSDVIGLAGGELQYRSRFSKIRVIRRDLKRNEVKIINVDFVAYLTKNDFSQNVKLVPGDVLFVPTTNSPDFQQISQFVNTAFILQSFGNFFGLNLGR